MFFRSLLVTLLLCPIVQASGQEASSQTQSLYDIPVEPMVGQTTAPKSLAPYKGQVLLLVNVASKCGFTPQYEGLESLYRKYREKGLVVIAFPSNDFGGQEPGSEQDILHFCKSRYDVTFPIFAKMHAKGPEKAPLYAHLISVAPKTGEVSWNFEKFLVSRDGRVVGRYKSKVKPDDPQLTAAIEKELAAK